MNFTLNTHELQMIVLALICNDSIVCKDDQESVNRLIDIFASANRMTMHDRNYTLNFSVE